MTKRILTIDGGGLRGVFAAAVIEQMELANKNKKSSDIFDCFIGTSAGALIAAGLAHGRSARYLRDRFIALGDEIGTAMNAAAAAGNAQNSEAAQSNESSTNQAATAQVLRKAASALL